MLVQSSNGSQENYAFSEQSTLPDTGITRNYTFEVARATLAPDGYEKPMIVVNGQYPGPLIEANLGDWIEVTVKNSIAGPEEGTAIHWHGFLQQETPWFDGVPSGMSRSLFIYSSYSQVSDTLLQCNNAPLLQDLTYH